MRPNSIMLWVLDPKDLDYLATVKVQSLSSGMQTIFRLGALRPSIRKEQPYFLGQKIVASQD